jgi:uncharacterized protein (TIGR04255 family)
MEVRARKIGNLLKKPLVEAIFELRWSLYQTGPREEIAEDPAWDLLPGLFYSRISKQFPTSLTLPTNNIPPPLAPYVVRHQFRPAPDNWPVIQLGPGILTVNQTEGYSVWDDFVPNIRSALSALQEAYPANGHRLILRQAELRYINAVALNEIEQQSPTRFLADNLHTSIEINADLFEDGAQTLPNEVNLSLAFPLAEPKGRGAISFSSGKRANEPALIWQFAVQSQSPDIPPQVADLSSWSECAHSVIEKWFLALSAGKLLDSFHQATQ